LTFLAGEYAEHGKPISMWRGDLFMSSNQESEGLFDLSDDVLAVMKRVGATMSDAVRAVRPGGPLDDSKYVTDCCECGVEKAETVRWFCDREFTCECGGKFDMRPLHAFWEAVANRDKSEAERIYREFFRPIEPVEE
jgi:hypothetical protein